LQDYSQIPSYRQTVFDWKLSYTLPYSTAVVTKRQQQDFFDSGYVTLNVQLAPGAHVAPVNRMQGVPEMAVIVPPR
jgi:hypothetical protein